MEYLINEDCDAKIIFCTLRGELDIQESVELSRALREKAAAKNYNIFYDARELSEPASIVPVLNFTKDLSRILQISEHRNVKVAFQYQPGEYDEHWKFYEDAAVNRGLQIRVFTEKEDAVNWLLER